MILLTTVPAKPPLLSGSVWDELIRALTVPPRNSVMTLLTQREAASVLRLSTRTLERWRVPAPVIDHEPPVSAEEMKRPFSRYRRY